MADVGILNGRVMPNENAYAKSAKATINLKTQTAIAMNNYIINYNNIWFSKYKSNLPMQSSYL